MFRWLKRLLPNSPTEAAKTNAALAAGDSFPDGDVLFHQGAVLLLGEEGAADLERSLAESRREQDYKDRVERMERVVELRRRELAARREFESLD